ncbi:VWA domain-containing protein [Lentzea sp. NPDC058450]|uniref:VWA domain-containing protein n=1 Tax=Lentzea sp. NPDC058450 TaxID=3346505 RepID=UPI00365147A1
MTPQGSIRSGSRTRLFHRLLRPICVLGVVATSLTPASAAGQPANDEPQVRPVHMVVLVDESGSIDQTAMDREKEAASLIAVGEFSPGSTISIVGFASDNGGQSPVDQVCPTTQVKSAQDRESLTNCVQKLRKREQNQGDGTDHAAAMRQALTNLEQAPQDEAKVVFLLTDGNLNVSDSPIYGKDNVADRRNEAAREELRKQLTRANEKSVQIWPLGFGNVDRAQLDLFAAGGSQRTCGVNSPKPEAKVVNGPGDVRQSLLNAYRSSRCFGGGAVVETPIKPGGTVTAPVEIPLIATDGSIMVFRQDNRIKIEYIDPNGRTVPKSDRLDDSQFQVSGESGPVEALRVVNPLPGTWTVKITTPGDVPQQSVGTTVIWQGAARAVLSVDPPAPEVGKPVTVGVRLQTRKSTIVDTATLTQLTFTAQMSGEGFAPIPVTLADNGQLPDATANDGQYTGTVVIPASATGALKFTGAVSGLGVQGDERTQSAVLAQGRPPVRAQARLTETAPFVPPGEARAGILNVTNDSGQARKVKLVIADPGPGTLVSASPAVFDLPPSGEEKFDYRLTFASNTTIGVNSGTLQVVDADDPTIVWHSMPFTIAVSYPPTLVQQLLWLWITLAVLLVALLVYLLVRMRTRARQRDVRGLSVHVSTKGRDGYLPAGDRAATVFRFTVRDEGGSLRLNHAAQDEPGYELRRTGGGAAELRPPDGARVMLEPGKPVSIGTDVELLYQDARPAKAARVPRKPRDTGPKRRPGAAGKRGKPVTPQHTPSRPAADAGVDTDDLL